MEVGEEGDYNNKNKINVDFFFCGCRSFGKMFTNRTCTELLCWSLSNFNCLFFFFFFFFFAKHIIVGRLFRNIHPSLQYSFHSRIHTSLYDFFPHLYIQHYAFSPWLQCAQFSFLSLSQ